jgi:hypothetical protein
MSAFCAAVAGATGSTCFLPEIFTVAGGRRGGAACKSLFIIGMFRLAPRDQHGGGRASAAIGCI